MALDRLAPPKSLCQTVQLTFVACAFRTTFCLSPARKAWLSSQSLSLKVLADNAADVWINGVKLLSDAVNDHEPVYWNNIISVAGNNAVFIEGGWGGGDCWYAR